MLTGLKTLALRVARTAVQHAPEILMVLGTAGVVGGTAVTVKQAMKLDGELLEFDLSQLDDCDCGCKSGCDDDCECGLRTATSYQKIWGGNQG